MEEIRILRDQLKPFTGWIFLEFAIPRMGARVDAILIHGPVVFVLEFKVGENTFATWAFDQVWDYALDLKNFHETSHLAWIAPVLVPTAAAQPFLFDIRHDADKVFRPIGSAPKTLGDVLSRVMALASGDPLDPILWSQGAYRPTPTIIEAARALYANHSVEELARNDAGAQNLTATSARLEALIQEARTERKKVICFVTGVPGAGKTLAGLNLATRCHQRESAFHSVFLSGNGPLVAVLREALARDEIRRRKYRDPAVCKKTVLSQVKAFIQNVHHFRDDADLDLRPPAEHVAIFDEAQRAWDATQTARFMRQKRRKLDWTQSEPEFLISCMDRHSDWAVVVCLVGGGQEIHTGEAGISAWLEAINSRFPAWHAYISPRLTDTEYASGQVLQLIQSRPNTHFDECLHLAVSMRSFRAENLSAFVKALLDCDIKTARDHWESIRSTYPIVLTRDLNMAKQWLRHMARGSERYGLLASSRAMRLKPHAIDIRVSVDPVCWFLNDRSDIRSSYYLEDAATEFQVQGLELDWSCVAWDADLRHQAQGWGRYDFRGTQWCRVGTRERQQYVLNAYRVLLTRARQGMVIFVPPGDRNDPTRRAEFYDSTFNYFCELGIPMLD
ncbi:DUF2075 domain-containing protein [Limisphaera sp. 4302-co]|uniref:DUF2075 domain-containing protein n=1 Tax=Limisphaera sp. 4302-co TaxID=3400417 RepID=UPI003C19E3C9